MYRILLATVLALSGVEAARADIVLNTPAGLTPGQQFQFIFITSQTTTALSSDINYYNNFVQTQATSITNQAVWYNGVNITSGFTAIVSTATISAASNIGSYNVPVYNGDGLIANSTTTSPGGLWSGSILLPISSTLEGTAPFPLTYKVWTGTMASGQANSPYEYLGSPNGLSTVGLNTLFTNQDWIADSAYSTSNTYPLYGISQVLTVPGAAVPEPSSIMLTFAALAAACGWRLARHRSPAELPLSAFIQLPSLPEPSEIRV